MPGLGVTISEDLPCCRVASCGRRFWGRVWVSLSQGFLALDFPASSLLGGFERGAEASLGMLPGPSRRPCGARGTVAHSFLEEQGQSLKFLSRISTCLPEVFFRVWFFGSKKVSFFKALLTHLPQQEISPE